MLTITTLGGLSISVDDQPIPRSVTAKALALLCYLAVTGRSQTREVLLALLWSEMEETEAQNNLRQALFQLKKYAEPYLLVTRTEVSFDRTQQHWLDVNELEWLARSDDGRPTTRLRSRDDGQQGSSRLPSRVVLRPPSVVAASEPSRPDDTSLLSGEFLQGFSVKNAPEFETWVAGQRARFGETAAQVLLQHAHQHATTANMPAALDAYNRLLARDPWREEAHQQKMLLLARAGQHSAALAQYEVCKASLQRELGVPPAPDTRRLAERIARAKERPALQLPHEASTFVGRVAERSALNKLLAQADVQLVTVLGPGGIGKTRLALEVARASQHTYLEGVAWVPLQAVRDVTQVLTAIIGALGLPAPRQPKDALNALTDYLRDKDLLLVLDNVEHVLDVADDLSRLLQASVGLRILATSRERLNLRWENVYALEGLPFASAPESDASSEAAQLFAARSKSVQHAFSPDATDKQAIDQICTLLGGMPLAIELACGMMPLRTVAAIAQTLTQDVSALSTRLRDTPARQRSLRAVFDQSWSALSAAERAAARQLAVFRGGFTAEAGLAVGQTSVAVLQQLADKSFVHRQEIAGTVRFSLHEVLRVFAQEALDGAGENTAARHRHLDVYAEAAAAQFIAMTGPQQARVLAGLQREEANLTWAWQWAIEQGNHAAMHRMLPAIYRYATIASGLALWLPRFEAALAALHETPTPSQPIEAMLEAILQSRLGGALNATGDYERARALLRDAVAALDTPENQVECQLARLLLGNGWLAQGKLPEAEAAFAQAIDSADSYAAGAALANLALIDQRLGRYEQAIARHEARLQQAQIAGDIRNQAITRMNAATVFYALHQYEACEVALREAGVLWDQTNDQIGTAMTMGNLAELLLERQQPDAAEPYLRRALAVFRNVGHRHMVAATLGTLGKLAFQRGQLGEAHTTLTECLTIAQALGATDQLAMHQQTLAEVFISQGDVATGRATFRAALRAATDAGEQRYQFECLLRLAELDAAAGTLALPRRVLATLLAQESLPADLRARASALALTVVPALHSEPIITMDTLMGSL